MILSDGCDDFIRKPFREEEIFKSLEKHLGARFLTEKEQPMAPGIVPAPAMTADLLSRLGDEWRGDFRKATVEADYGRLEKMIEAIRPSHRSAADSLSALLQSFEYQKILEALDGADASAAGTNRAQQ